MGEARTKRERFILQHPKCCFCGGNEPAVTIDHVPNRASFPGKIGPEGFEFPACQSCQNATRLDEIVFAATVHMIGNDGTYDADQFRKLVSGLANNIPEALPRLEWSANEKRRALRELGIEKPIGATYADAPIAGLSDASHERIRRYIRKIVLALYYKHVGASAGPNMRVWSTWSSGRDKRAHSAINAWTEITPFVEIGARTNMDFGDRFRVRMNYDPAMPAFIAMGQFHRGLIFYGTCATAEVAERILVDPIPDGSEYPPGDWS